MERPAACFRLNHQFQRDVHANGMDARQTAMPVTQFLKPQAPAPARIVQLVDSANGQHLSGGHHVEG